MRLSKGTIILIVAMVAIIATALFMTSNPAFAPAIPTPTATVALGGRLFETLNADQAAITRWQVRDNLTGESTAYVKNADGIWEIEGGGPAVEQQPILDAVQSFATLNANDTFEGADPSQFGLDQPAYSIFVSTAEGDAVYALHVGGKTFNNARYYVTTQSLTGDDLPGTTVAEAPIEGTAEAAAEATPESTVEPVVLSGTITISTIPQRTIDSTFRALLIPVFAPEVTVEATPEATEIMEIIGTPEAMPEAEAAVEAEATPEVTPEATEAG
ncbi:MAG: hypothetical protein IAE89_00550 [Anaerolineae bacterium]|nr:hypothetical protein [Anaerolineae bacterium]